MVIAALVIFGLAGLVGAVIAYGLRRMFLDEEKEQVAMRTGDAHVVEYAIPAGVDPADVRAAIAIAGFTGVVVDGPSGERLRVVCSEADRVRVRRAIEEAHSAASGDAPLGLGPVVFVDERPA